MGTKIRLRGPQDDSILLAISAILAHMHGGVYTGGRSKRRPYVPQIGGCDCCEHHSRFLNGLDFRDMIGADGRGEIT